MQHSNLNILASNLNKMKNPKYIGASVGAVVSASPITVSIAGGSILLKEGEELYISDRLKDKTLDCVIKITGESDKTGKITIKPELKKGDFVFVVPMEGEQMWVAVDRVGGIS